MCLLKSVVRDSSLDVLPKKWSKGTCSCVCVCDRGVHECTWTRRVKYMYIIQNWMSAWVVMEMHLRMCKCDSQHVVEQCGLTSKIGIQHSFWINKINGMYSYMHLLGSRGTHIISFSISISISTSQSLSLSPDTTLPLPLVCQVHTPLGPVH